MKRKTLSFKVKDEKMILPDEKIIKQIATTGYADPFSVLGIHKIGDKFVIRTVQPQAKSVSVIRESTQKAYQMEKVDECGLFQAEFDNEQDYFLYKLKIELCDGDVYEIEDTYRFMPVLSEQDIYLINEGRQLDLYKKLGAHLITHQGVKGAVFAVWAPNASRVSVVGDFNQWDGRRNVMRPRGSSGIWELFIPHLVKGDVYKYELLDKNGQLLPLKADPVGFYAEVRPATASIIWDIDEYKWRDNGFVEKRKSINAVDAPMSIYEVHLGSWKRVPEENYRELTYRELAEQLPNYVKEMGYTHVEFLPVAEHPFDGSWGYQVIGMFAPTSRFGNPDDFKYLIDALHDKGIGVIIDWVPGHFPKDTYGLAEFDGTCLYEHQDERQGVHKAWGTKIYNFGRNEVQNFLIANALFWLKEYHVDALRVDAVASMLYLDYDRKQGEWIPNQYGGHENLEAIAFLRRVNEEIFSLNMGYTTMAEESTAWPMVSKPTYIGGLGFGYKWNMGWMHDTLMYMSKDPVYRKYEHDKMTFGLIYAFNENFILPLSHDEVVHMKGSLIGKMPGDEWQKFANLRAYYGFMFTHPGKKLLFMGAEFGQTREWAFAESLSWNLLEYDIHNKLKKCVMNLNRIYKENPALYQVDFEPEGFEWINMNDGEASVFSYIRKAKNKNDFLIVINNFTPVVRENYLLGAPECCDYEIIFNSDCREYGGSGLMDNVSKIPANGRPWNYKKDSVSVTLPPLSTIILKPKTTT